MVGVQMEWGLFQTAIKWYKKGFSYEKIIYG